MASFTTRLARGVAALFALTLLFLASTSSTAFGQTSYTISPGGSITLATVDQAGMCGGDMSNRNVSFTNGTLYVLGTAAGGSPVSTFKSYIDAGWVVYTHNGDGATQVTITISGDGCGNSRTVTVNITQSGTAPTVTLHPQSVTLCEGPNIVLRSAASGSPVPTAHWQVSTDDGATWADETVWQGRDSDTLLMSSTTGITGYQYRNVYTNANGSDTTDAATITTQSSYLFSGPANAAVCAGSTATFAAVVAAVGSPVYRWEVSTDAGGSWTTVDGATTATLAFTADPSHDGNLYRMILTNGGCGTITTDPASLSVTYAPTVTTEPIANEICDGQTATFIVAATASPAATVLWQVSTDGGSAWSEIAGETSTTLSFTASASQDGGLYRAIFSNSCGADTTATAALTVGSAPTITGQPASIAICTGYSTTLEVTATALGSAPITYQWRKGGVDIGLATASTYTITDATIDDAGSYDVVVTGCGAPVTSDAAIVTIAPPPSLAVTLNRSVISSSVRALVAINATVATSGGCSTRVELDAITSSDADTGVVPGDLAGDIVADSLDVSPAERTFQLRAEAAAAGRVYTIVYRITDGAYEAFDTSHVVALPSTATFVSGPESTGFTMTEATPNPTSTSASFTIASGAACAASAYIYSTSGMIVKTLLTNYLGTGTTITWDLTNNAGVRVPAGVYIYQVKSCGGRRSGAIIVL